MFWTNIYTLSPHIEALLNKEDVTLQELMDQEEIVAECKSQNKKLVDYLTRPEIIEELVTLTTKEPSESIDERSRYKYPNIACELLTCNVPTLNEKLAGSEELLVKLYSFIDTDENLNPLLASFFSKIIGVLLIRKCDQNWYSYQFMCLQVLEFLKSRDNFVDRLLQHLETSAIMDLVLKLVTKIEGNDMIRNVKKWLDEQQLGQKLIKLLTPTIDNDKHTNSSQLLCDIIKSSREYRISSIERTDPDPILNTLESEETVSLLLEIILAEPQTETSIVGGIQILLVLLGQESTSQQIEPDMQGNNSGDDVNEGVDRVKIQNATLQYMERLHKLLVTPPPKPAVKTTAGLLECPLGNTRLHIAKLISALLSATENNNVFEKLQEFGTIEIILNLFFKYSWNNFLHIQVEQCLALLINGNWQENNIPVYTHIFTQCKLIERILEAWENNENEQKAEKGVRQGYMGHLISIANNIVKQAEKCEDFDKFLKTNVDKVTYEKWESLVNTQLAEINKTNEILLGGKLQAYMTSSEDSSEDYNSYSQDAYAQQVYTNYQGQQMTSQVIEHYGFHDDEFNDGNDALQPSNSVDQLTTMPFAISEEDLVKQEDMFNKICQQKQKSGLDEGGIEWGDEGDLTFQTVIDKRDWPFKQQQNDSMSSDEDEETKDLQMEIDTTDPWDNDSLQPQQQQQQQQNILPQVNPWGVVTSPTDNTANWANFDNFENSLPNFDKQQTINDDVNLNSHKITDENSTIVNDNELKINDDDDLKLTVDHNNDEIIINTIVVPETTDIHDKELTKIDDKELTKIDDSNLSNIDDCNLSNVDKITDDKVEEKITIANVIENKIEITKNFDESADKSSDKIHVNQEALSSSTELEKKTETSEKSKDDDSSVQPSGSLTTL